MFSISIKDRRQALNITQRELAKRIGVDQSCVALWEAGKTFPTRNNLPKVAKALQCSISDLISDKYRNEIAAQEEK